ncbi:hypothetical protein GOBAR_DD08074 [Gossypium barbadense]|nr:hypothetical protein GOBAR_DD08074 [Gossypium barbadense]
MLKALLLSSNQFSLLSTTVINVTVPKFTLLTLASCNLSKFPNFLSSQDKLEYLDLGGNKIHGFIPKWIWGLSAQTLQLLDLSENFLPASIYQYFVSNNYSREKSHQGYAT